MSDSMRWFSLVLVAIFLGVIYWLGPILMPFIISFLLAYFLNPIVIRLHQLKIPRFVSAFVILLIIIALISGFFFALIPALEKQIAIFIHKLPAMFNWVKNIVVPWINAQLHLNINLGADNIHGVIMQRLHTHGENFAKAIFNTVFNSGYMVIEFAMNLIMIPVITLYLLIDWVKVTTHGKRLLPLPAAKREVAADLIKECGDVLAGFLRGQLLVMIGSGIVYGVGLSLLGVDLALLIGVIAGTLTIVPYLGFITGLLIGVIATAIQFHSVFYIIGAVAVFVLGTLCENFVFSPLFVGDRIGLHPVAVIFAVLAGGKLFGFVGVLIALPVAAVVMVLFRHLHRHYFGKEDDKLQEEAV